jgi:hypothetical protein
MNGNFLPLKNRLIHLIICIYLCISVHILANTVNINMYIYICMNHRRKEKRIALIFQWFDFIVFAVFFTGSRSKILNQVD